MNHDTKYCQHIFIGFLLCKKTNTPNTKQKEMKIHIPIRIVDFLVDTIRSFPQGREADKDIETQ